MSDIRHGLRENRAQFLHLLLQVGLVGLCLGLTRTVVPALAETEFGLPRDSYTLLATFVVAFGLVKAALNFVAGQLSERIGRRPVLLLGWIAALPIPLLIYFAPGWNWIVAATLLLGVSQGLTWSMTQTSQLDLTRADERGRVVGLNEFAGYLGMAAAGLLTAWLAQHYGARPALLGVGLVIVLAALLLVWTSVEETRPWALAERAVLNTAHSARPRYARARTTSPRVGEVFALMSWRDPRMATLCQAGLVEKFVDALVWVFYPVFLYRKGLALAQVASVVGAYGLVWGVAQLFTGRWSDRVGRQWPNVLGMLLCGAGVAAMPFGDGVWAWTAAAALSGLGMALLYPNLSAAVADIAPPDWRGAAIGIYRFWRDLGYGLGALGLGWIASGGGIEAAFWAVALSMLCSGLLLAWLGEETHPRLNPA